MAGGNVNTTYSCEMGFPSEKLPNVIAHCKIKGWKVKEGDNGTWIINSLPVVDGFQEWKNELVEKQDENKPKERISLPGLVREDNKTTSTLPVYKDAYDLMLEVYQFSKHFDREYRFTLGERLKNEILELLINVYQAQTSDNKKGEIVQARTHAELSRLLLRVSKDLHLIELKRFIRLNEKIEDIMRQLSGWLKAQK